MLGSTSTTLFASDTSLAIFLTQQIMMASNNTTKSPQLPKWQSITLPLIAGLLHLQVFYYAAVHCLLRVRQQSSNDISSDEFRNECFLLDRAIFLAYVFDLLCCWFKVIPFSRTYLIHMFVSMLIFNICSSFVATPAIYSYLLSIFSTILSLLQHATWHRMQLLT